MEQDNKLNVLAVELFDRGVYLFGTFENMLEQLYAISQFTLCPKNLLISKKIPDHEIRLVVNAFSIGKGQGFVKCVKYLFLLMCLFVSNIGNQQGYFNSTPGVWVILYHFIFLS